MQVLGVPERINYFAVSFSSDDVLKVKQIVRRKSEFSWVDDVNAYMSSSYSTDDVSSHRSVRPSAKSFSYLLLCS